MKNIYLYGANCTKAVWDELKLILDNPEDLIIKYPHGIEEVEGSSPSGSTDDNRRKAVFC